MSLGYPASLAALEINCTSLDILWKDNGLTACKGKIRYQMRTLWLEYLAGVDEFWKKYRYGKINKNGQLAAKLEKHHRSYKLPILDCFLGVCFGCLILGTEFYYPRNNIISFQLLANWFEDYGRYLKNQSYNPAMTLGILLLPMRHLNRCKAQSCVGRSP